MPATKRSSISICNGCIVNRSTRARSSPSTPTTGCMDLAMAVAMRGELADQVILHADRGCQYTSAQLARFAREPTWSDQLVAQRCAGTTLRPNPSGPH
jgi:transposase InsO family protein